MARCKFLASSILVLLVLSVSAAAQSNPISEQGTKPCWVYHRSDVDVVRLVNGKLDLPGSGEEILADTNLPENTQCEYVYFGGSRRSALYCPVSLQTLHVFPMVGDDPKLFADLDLHLCLDSANSCATLRIDDSPAQPAEGQAKAQTVQSLAYQAPDKNNPKEVELDDVIFNETGGLRADPKAKPGAPGSAENLHDARVAVAEVAKRVLESSHPEREQAPRTLTRETLRDLNAGNKDVIRSLNDSLSAARSGSNTTSGAMHFRTGRHKFKSLYGRKGTMYFGPFRDATGGRHYYLTIAP